MISYHQQTLGSPNPLARFAHHSRLARARHLLATRTGVRRALDYGCGSGEFLACLSGTAGLEAVGYEPFMQERAADGLPIHASLEAVTALAPFDVITVLETVEHLSDEEMLALLRQADGLLAPGGSLLFSAPIEIGPALLLKHLNRARRQRRWSGSLPIGQLLAASILGIPPRGQWTSKPATRALISAKPSVFSRTISALCCWLATAPCRSAPGMATPRCSSGCSGILSGSSAAVDKAHRTPPGLGPAGIDGVLSSRRPPGLQPHRPRWRR